MQSQVYNQVCCVCIVLNFQNMSNTVQLTDLSYFCNGDSLLVNSSYNTKFEVCLDLKPKALK